jgi:glycosyltransferase involved in cell wall biosynthesis
MQGRKFENLNSIVKERYDPNDEYLGREKEVNLKKPVVSVLMATYNHEQYIADAIESVLMQKTSFDIELLIGEDESSDATRAICKRYAEEYPHIIRLFLWDRSRSHLCDKSGKSIQFFNMRWLRMSARGEFFAVCEGDDFWCDDNKLEKQVKAMKGYPECAMCFHPAKVKNMKNPELNRVTDIHKESPFLFSVEEIILGGGSFCPSASLMFRKQALIDFDRVTADLILPVGDVYTQICGALNGGALFLPEVMSVYRTGVQGSWTQRNSEYTIFVPHKLDLIKTNREIDTRLDKRYHHAFRLRENGEVHRLFKHLYQHDKDVRKRVVGYVRKETNGMLKLQSYKTMFYSFLYHKMNLKFLTPHLRQLRLRRTQKYF